MHLHEKAGIADVRLCVLQIPNGTLAAAKEAASKQMVEVLHAYRRNCSTQSAPGQLVLPEALKLSPLYNLSLSKCPAFR
jgi:protein transport protein SEC24